MPRSLLVYCGAVHLYTTTWPATSPHYVSFGFTQFSRSHAAHALRGLCLRLPPLRSSAFYSTHAPHAYRRCGPRAYAPLPAPFTVAVTLYLRATGYAHHLPHRFVRLPAASHTHLPAHCRHCTPSACIVRFACRHYCLHSFLPHSRRYFAPYHTTCHTALFAVPSPPVGPRCLSFLHLPGFGLPGPITGLVGCPTSSLIGWIRYRFTARLRAHARLLIPAVTTRTAHAAFTFRLLSPRLRLRYADSGSSDFTLTRLVCPPDFLRYRLPRTVAVTATAPTFCTAHTATARYTHAHHLLLLHLSRTAYTRTAYLHAFTTRYRCYTYARVLLFYPFLHYLPLRTPAQVPRLPTWFFHARLLSLYLHTASWLHTAAFAVWVARWVAPRLFAGYTRYAF